MSIVRPVMVFAVLALASETHAQSGQPVKRENAVTATATIQAIDSTTRSITLRNEQGDEDTFTAGPEVKRFNELKVGDKIRLTYYESIVFELRKPDAKSNEGGDTLAAGRTKDMPGGAVASQQMRTVTVKAVDPDVPSITVLTQDGRTITRKIEDKKVIEGVKPGDRIDITYTQAVIVNTERVK